MEIRKEAPGWRDRGRTVADYRNCFSLSNGEFPLENLRYRGVALVWTVIVVLALVLMVGLSLDYAKMSLVNHQLHIAADAGALAGGPWVKKEAEDYFRPARELAQAMAAANIADHDPVDLDLNLDNLPDGDIIVGNYAYLPPEQGEEQGMYLFIPYDPLDPIPVNALAVIASRDVDDREGHLATQQVALNFGPMAGVVAVDISGNWQGEPPGLRGPYAIALIGGGTGSGLICLRHDGMGFHAQGTGRIVVNNLTGDPQQGSIQVNSDDDEVSVTLNGTPDIVVDYMTITAEGFDQVGDFDLYENTTVLLGQPRMGDPLYWLNHSGFKPTEYIGTADDLGGINIQNSNQVPADPIEAGYYSGGLTFKGGTEANPVRLESGVYILDGVGLQVFSNSYVVVDPTGGDSDGNGIGEAFFYIASGDWEASGTSCLIENGGVFKAQPLTTEPYAGIIIAQDDLNLNDARITGNGQCLIEGTLYFPQERPAEEQKQHGNGEGFSLSLGGTGLGTGNQVIASSLFCHGTGDKIINYYGDNPSPVTDAWLVE